MIDLQTVKDSYRRKEINNIAFILSEDTLSDPIAKVDINIFLMSALGFIKISDSMPKWVIQNAIKKSEDDKDGSVDKIGGLILNFQQSITCRRA